MKTAIRPEGAQNGPGQGVKFHPDGVRWCRTATPGSRELVLGLDLDPWVESDQTPQQEGGRVPFKARLRAKTGHESPRVRTAPTWSKLMAIPHH